MRLIRNASCILSCLVLVASCNPKGGSEVQSSVKSSISQPLPTHDSPALETKKDVLELGSLVSDSIKNDKELILINVKYPLISKEIETVSLNANTTIAVTGHELMDQTLKEIDCEASGSACN